MDSRLAVFEEKMGKSLANLEEEFAGIRAGRANPHVLDKVKVDYYGVATPINQIAGISVPEPRMILIQPWDISMLKEIEKAINIAEIGINPNNDGKVIRLAFPELTEERRKDLVKDIRKIAEESKVAIRAIRRDGMDMAKTAQKNIEFYMNNNYTIFRTFKEDGSCIEKSWVFWKHGKKMNTANLLFCRGQDRWGRLILF